MAAGEDKDHSEDDGEPAAVGVRWWENEDIVDNVEEKSNDDDNELG